MNSEKILITGARGYIGQAIARQLPSRRLKLQSRTKWDSAPVQGLEGAEFCSAQMDTANDWERCIEDVGVIIHLSAQTNLKSAIADPARDWHENVGKTKLLVKALKRDARHKRLVLFASTATLYGLTTDFPVSETAPIHPLSPYEKHKYECEQHLMQLQESGSANVCALRLANVYGRGATVRNTHRGVVNMMMNRALRGEALTVYGTGEYLRDFVHIDDVARAFIAAQSAVESTAGNTFNICTGVGTSLLTLMQRIAVVAEQITGSQPDIRLVPEPDDLHPIERRNFVGDARKFMRLTGWSPKRELSDYIKADMEQLHTELMG